MLRPYQEEAIEKVEEAWEDGIRDPSVDIFCGLGKSVILLELIVRFDGLMAIVMPSLSLVQQFCGKYLGPHRHLAFCTLAESTEGVAIGTTDPAEAVAFSSEPGIFVVTYKSLAKLLEHVPDIERLLFDEAHHVAEEANAYIKGMDAEVAYFSATPDKDVGTEVFRFSYFDSLMSDPQYSQDFRIQCGMFTGEQGDSLLELIERTAEKTGNKRILTFHSKVNGDSPTSVRNFARMAVAHFGDRVTVAYMDADTPMGERVRLLERLDSTPDDQIFLLASCETIGEGVDTKRCNHIVFVDPVKSYVKAVQKLGRCVRRQQTDNPSTVLIPIFLERAKYEACTTAEERDAMVRSEYSERGDFNPVFNFICAVRESDPDLLDLILSSKCLPAARLEHYRKIVGDSPRLTFEEAVEKLTGERTTNIQDAALRTNKTIEVHDRDGNVTQYGGEAAAVDSIVEMEPDAYVTVHGGVPTPPREKRIEFVESPFLLSVNLEKEVIDYEVRPSVFQERVNQVTAFVAEHGRLPKKRENENNVIWIGHQRTAYRNGKLSPERIQTLGEIPLWTWGDAREDAFQTAVTKVTAFVTEHGRLPYTFENNGGWIRHKRKAYRKGKLSTERIQTLGEIPHWTWGEAHEDAYKTSVAEVTAFVTEHGRLPMKGENNGGWIDHQRKAYRKGKLSTERIQTLGEIPHWTWGEAHEDIYEKTVAEVTAFSIEHGRLPTRLEKNGNWINKQRIAYRKGKLSPERIQTLGEIPCWTWGEAREDIYEKAVAEVTAFSIEHGRLPTRLEKNGNWICMQRQAYRKGKLSPDRIQTIGKIPCWSWGEAFEDAFKTSVAEVTAFVTEHGRLPKNCEENNDWIINQRQAYRKKKLTSERIRDLEAIPLWTWDGRASTTSARSSVESDESDMQDEDHETTPMGADVMDREKRPQLTEDELVQRRMETRTHEELARQDVRQARRGYTAPNPKNKDEINALFANSLPEPRGGVVVFLDHTDFKTAHAVGDRPMRIPQRDPAAYEAMRAHAVYGRYVVFGDFNEVLRGITDSIEGVYADFTGPLKVGLEFVEVCKQLVFAPSAVVGVTICLRNPEGSSFTNEDVVLINAEVQEELQTVSLRDDHGQKIGPMCYGNGASMVTVMQRKRA
jgi:superfamily II DNA or RNA helicase